MFADVNQCFIYNAVTSRAGEADEPDTIKLYAMVFGCHTLYSND